MRDKDHLDHLPGKTYLGVMAAVAVVVAVAALAQMVSANGNGSVVLWGVVLSLAVVSLVASVVAWEERRAHIHALVREVLETDAEITPDIHAAAMAELLRLGAHREVELVRDHAGPGAR